MAHNTRSVNIYYRFFPIPKKLHWMMGKKELICNKGNVYGTTKYYWKKITTLRLYTLINPISKLLHISLTLTL